MIFLLIIPTLFIICMIVSFFMFSKFLSYEGKIVEAMLDANYKMEHNHE